MKSHRKELCFEIPRRRAFLNITPEIEACLRESGIREGLCLVNAMHISASVFINDDESGLHQDFEKWLEKLAPENPHSQYRHNGAEDNADAHLKRILKLDRLRLRDPNRATDEFHLAAAAQNSRKMAKMIPMPSPAPA